jgi:hypothetical protein
MQKELRQHFNDNFSQEKYAAYLQEIENLHPGTLEFRIAETPIFIPKDFTQKMLDACEDIVDVLVQPGFKALTEKAIPIDAIEGAEKDHPEFIVFDFGICENSTGALEPQLIEMQGFPTLFAFQAFHTAISKLYAEVPNTYDAYLSGYTETTYLQLLQEIAIAKMLSCWKFTRSIKKQGLIFIVQKMYWV